MALKVPLEAQVIGHALGIPVTHGAFLWALVRARGPLHELRISLLTGLTEQSVRVIATRARSSLPCGRILCREHCYTLTDNAKTAIKLQLTHASDVLALAGMGSHAFSTTA